MTATTVTPGAKVRITAKNVGVLDRIEATRFAADAPEGTEGTYLGIHPSLPEDDWHVIEVELDGRTYFAPLHRSHFEVVAVVAYIDPSESVGARVSNSAEHVS